METTDGKTALAPAVPPPQITNGGQRLVPCRSCGRHSQSQLGRLGSDGTRGQPPTYGCTLAVAGILTKETIRNLVA
jgi:hypothetical protein